MKMSTKTLRFSLLAAMSLALTCFASDPQSGPDQYAGRQHDQSHPHRSISEALKALKLQHRFDLPPKMPVNEDVFDNNVVPDLQVGCGDGIFVETTTTPKPAIPKHKRVFPRKERRKREANDRKSRSYYDYSLHTAAANDFSVWRPNTFKFPINYPPKSVYRNPGSAVDNPRRPTKITITDRFAVPVWDSRPDTAVAPITSTRRPSRPNTSTFPPLIHRPDPNLAAATARPTIRPVATTTTTTTVPPPRPAESNAAPTTNQCVWAIINCCSGGSKVVNQNCFERLGCPGPFWGKSPCEGDFARIAIEYALNHFQGK